MSEKKQLREKVKSMLAHIDETELHKKNNAIFQRLIKERVWMESRTVGIYVSIGKEVNTSRIIEHAWLEGKRIAVPKVNMTTKEMQFYEIRSFSQLEATTFGLQEPIVSKCQKVDNSAVDLLIVPGLAFSKEGFRLGYGGGFYDRYIQTYNGKTIALTYEAQMVEKIPVDPYDQAVHTILTEDEVYACR